MEGKQVVIVLEGIDCAGKGETTKALAARLGAVIYKSPPEEKRAEQDYVNATYSNEDHYRYFIQVSREASAAMQELSLSGHVVVDRYWMTTLVYHRVMGVDARIEDFGELFQPDLTVYLTVSPEVQAARFLERGMSPGDHRMDGRQHLIRAEYARVIDDHPPVLVIDTSQPNPEQVVDLILAGCPGL